MSPDEQSAISGQQSAISSGAEFCRPRFYHHVSHAKTRTSAVDMLSLLIADR
jgi:hypothetical protein